MKENGVPLAAEETNSFWATLLHSGWFVAILSTTWAALLRLLFGRYLEFQKESKADRIRLNETMRKIEERLWHLEERARFEDRKK